MGWDGAGVGSGIVEFMVKEEEGEEEEEYIGYEAKSRRRSIEEKHTNKRGRHEREKECVGVCSAGVW